MEQKIIQIGNSTGIIIPKSLSDQFGLQAGSEVEIEENAETESLQITKKGSKKGVSTISPHFLKILDKVNQEYSPALKKLAQG